jgi:hypothetical protein
MNAVLPFAVVPDTARSLIFGTNKVKVPQGALGVFGLDGKIRQTVRGMDRGVRLAS